MPKTEIATVTLPTPSVSIETLYPDQNSGKSDQSSQGNPVGNKKQKSSKGRHQLPQSLNHHSTHHAPTL